MRSELPSQDTGEEPLAKSDRLFRASVSAYCSLTRPTGRDAAQLDDLALPLLPLVNDESKRFAAAALSESFPAPPMLLRRLADCPASISAPLLLRSRGLADIDLIGLIGRNGISHARAIARRPGLNGNIAALIGALGIAPFREPESPVADTAPTIAPDRAPPGEAAEETRDQLRAMMKAAPADAPASRPDRPIDWVAAHAAYARMVATGLTGVAALFHTTLADAFDMGFEGARRMVEEDDGAGLATALKAAGLSSAEAFLIAALAFPPRASTTGDIRAFIESYRALDTDEARRQVSAWRENSPRATATAGTRKPANLDGKPAKPAGILKAS